MSLPDMAEYWWKEPRPVKIPFTHIKGFNCGHFHVIETDHLPDVDCRACIKHIQSDVELVKKRTDQRLNKEKERLKEIKKKLSLRYPTNPNCPKCGMKMMLRKSKYGTFYGCSQYPNCKATKNI